MEVIKSNLLFAIGKYYVLGEREQKELESVVDNWAYESREENAIRLRRALSKASKLKEDDRGERKLEHAVALIKDLAPDSVLDFGAGEGDVARALAKRYKLPKDKIYALEPKNTSTSEEFTWIADPEELESGAVDLVVILAVFHHIHPNKRATILRTLYETLSADGVILIQEHAYNNSTSMYMSLDIYHNMWYNRNQENYDPLYLMTEAELLDEMDAAGLRLLSKVDPKGWQQLYFASFCKK